MVYIWCTCSRNYIPLKISWCFPKWVFSLVFLGVLIFEEIQMGSVSFIKSRVSPWILPKKIVWGCPENYLNSRVFWSKPRGLKYGCKTTFFYLSNGFCCHFHNLYLLGSSFYTKYHNIHQIFSYFIDQRPKMLRKNTFYASNWIFIFVRIFFWFTSAPKKYFFLAFLEVGQ